MLYCYSSCTTLKVHKLPSSIRLQYNHHLFLLMLPRGLLSPYRILWDHADTTVRQSQPTKKFLWMNIPIKAKNTWWTGKTNLGYFCHCSSWLLTESMPIFQAAEVYAKWWRPMLKPDTKWCTTCNNILWEIQPFNIMYLPHSNSVTLNNRLVCR